MASVRELAEMLCEPYTNNRDTMRRVRRRIRFHYPHPGPRTLRDVVYKCRAYEDLARMALGRVARTAGVRMEGFWTADEMRSALWRRMYADMDPDRDAVMATYDALLMEINDGEYDAEKVRLVESRFDAEAFLRRWTLGADLDALCGESALFKSMLNGIRDGKRNKEDMLYVRFMCERSLR